MRGAHLLTGFLTLLITLFRDVNGQGAFDDLTGFSLSPPYFNLAEGSSISATATCGQDEVGTSRGDLYCKLVGGPNIGHPTQSIQVRTESLNLCDVISVQPFAPCTEVEQHYKMAITV